VSVLKFFVVLLIFPFLLSQFFVSVAFAGVTEAEAVSTLISAEEAVVSGYQAVLGAENAGSNVSGLFVRLNDAGKLLAAARMSYRNGDFDTANLLAGLGENIGEGVQNDAVRLKDTALSEGSRRSLFTTVASVVGVAVVALGSFGVWHRLRKMYGEYRGWFIVGSLVLMLVAAVPASALYVHLPSGSESFSELWLLGPGHKAEDYPFNVKVNDTYSVYVGVGNHLGYSAYYRVSAKFRNQTQPLPVASSSTPSFLRELYEFDFFVRDGAVWETLLDFRIAGIERLNDFVVLNSVSINEVPFGIGFVSIWDSVRDGFYYQLFFELWSYNMTSQSFQYNNRFVGLWLNMTA